MVFRPILAQILDNQPLKTMLLIRTLFGTTSPPPQIAIETGF